MKYVSIDLETTGLSPNTCQVLEIAAVYNDDNLHLALCPIFHRYIWHPVIKGEAYALHMNADLIKEIHDLKKAGAKTDVLVDLGALRYQFRDWLADHGYPKFMNEDSMTSVKNVVAAGKNFANFDKGFLEELDVLDIVRFHHRVIDPAMYYHRVTDAVPPDTKLCLERAGFDGEVKHRAVDDALAVCRLVRKHFGVEL